VSRRRRGPSFLNVVRALTALYEAETSEVTRGQLSTMSEIPKSTIYNSPLLDFLCEMRLVERREREGQLFFAITTDGRTLVRCLEKTGLLPRILSFARHGEGTF